MERKDYDQVSSLIKLYAEKLGYKNCIKTYWDTIEQIPRAIIDCSKTNIQNKFKKERLTDLCELKGFKINK